MGSSCQRTKEITINHSSTNENSTPTQMLSVSEKKDEASRRPSQKEEKRETVLISGRAFKLASSLDLICDLEVDSSFSLSSSILSSIELKNEKEEVKCDTLQLLGCSCQRTIGSR